MQTSFRVGFRRDWISRVGVRAVTVLTVVAGSVLCPTASAQNSVKTAAPGQPKQVATPAPKGTPVEPGPYIQRLAPKDWNLDIRLRVTSRRSDILDNNQRPMTDAFSFTTTAIVFPEVMSSASHVFNEKGIVGELRIDDKPVVTIGVNNKNDWLMGNVYHSGSNLIKFEYTVPDGKSANASQVIMTLREPVTCYQTKFDEAAAMKVAWPKDEWPAIAKSTFQPQMFLDMDGQGPRDMTDLKGAVKRWLTAAGVNDPKNSTPVRVAKIITGGVVGDLQPSGEGRVYTRSGGMAQLEGLDIRTPAEILNDRRGNEVEIVAILVLALREAGLPARVVIGQEAAEGGDAGGNFLTQKRGGKELRVWAEFCLFDDVKNTINWVPIDPVQLRKVSSRPPPIDREWRYFGSHDQLNAIVPFAFTFHPPMPALRAYGSPAFYGWIMQPTSPTTAFQMIDFSTSRQSKTADDYKKQPDDKKDSKREKKTHEVKRGN